MEVAATLPELSEWTLIVLTFDIEYDFSLKFSFSLPFSPPFIINNNIAVIFSLSPPLWATLGESCLVSVQRDCNLENKRRKLRWGGWGSLQLCQSLVNKLYALFPSSA